MKISPSKVLLLAGVMLSAMSMSGARADDATAKSQPMGANWVSPTGGYSNQRYSTLDQITAANASKLQVAWTFSTGVLRGHEGAPLVIDNVMYLVTPFPNNVFALDLNDHGKILWKYMPKQDPNVIPVMCCDTVNRGVAYSDGKIFLHQADTTLVALDAKTGKVDWSVKTDDPAKGATGTGAPMVIGDKVYVGVSGGEFGVRGWLAAYSTADGKQVWRAYSMGPDSDILVDPEKTTDLGKPIGKDFEPQELAGRSVEDRRRRHLGLDVLRPEAQAHVLRVGQPLDVESDPAAGRQQILHDDLGARSRYRHGQVGLPDDPARPVGL